MKNSFIPTFLSQQSMTPSSPTANLPYNLEAEKTTLGALLLDAERIIDIAPILSHDDFYDPVLGAIYHAIARLHDNRTPIDFVTVADALSDDQKIQRIGGSAFLADLAASVPTSSHAMQ